MDLQNLLTPKDFTVKLTRKRALTILNKTISLFLQVEQKKYANISISPEDCNNILWHGTVFDSLEEVCRSFSIDYAELAETLKSECRRESEIRKLLFFDKLQTTGALQAATHMILNTKTGESNLAAIKQYYKKFSNKEKFVDSISTYATQHVNAFTVQNFITANSLHSSVYFKANALLRKIHEDSLDGEFERIVCIITKIIRLETDVTLREILIIISGTFEDETEISLHFLNILVNIMGKFDSSEYLKFWESLFESIADADVIELLNKCAAVPPFYKALLAFIEIYLKKVEIVEDVYDTQLMIPEDVHVDFILLSRFSIDDIAMLISMLASEKFVYHRDFECRLKEFCAKEDVYRYLKAKLFSLVKT